MALSRYTIIILVLASLSCKHSSSNVKTTTEPTAGCAENLQLFSEKPPVLESLFVRDEPINLQRGLSEHHYIAEEAYKIKKSAIRSIDLNYRFMRESGMETWDKKSLEFEKAILDRFAYITKRTVEKLGLHDTVDTDKTYLVYPDLYGGTTGGSNFGSGRAASLGGFSIKGIGYTNLSTRKIKVWFDTLASSAEEVISKLHHYGITHNQVIAHIQISPGLHIIVREDPIRMAHFLDFQSIAKQRLQPGPIQSKNQKRVESNPCLLRQAYLNMSPGGRDWKKGFLQSIKNMGQNLAKQLVNGVSHTAPTAANIALEGHFTDLESFIIHGEDHAFNFYTVSGPLNKIVSSKEKFNALYLRMLPTTYPEGLKFHFDHLYLPIFQELAQLAGIRPNAPHYWDIFQDSFFTHFTKDFLYKAGLAPKFIEDFPIKTIRAEIEQVLGELWGLKFQQDNYEACFEIGKCSKVRKKVIQYLKKTHGQAKQTTKKMLAINNTQFAKVPYRSLYNLAEKPSWVLINSAHNSKSGTSYFIFRDLENDRYIHKLFIPKHNGTFSGILNAPKHMEDITIKIDRAPTLNTKESPDGAVYFYTSNSSDPDIPSITINSMRAFGMNRAWPFAR